MCQSPQDFVVMAAQEARDQAGQMAGRAQDQAQQVGAKAQEMGGQAGKKAQGVFQKLKEVMPKSGVGWVALVAIAGAIAIGSVIVLVILSPVLLFFSPILVPVGIVLFLCTAGITAAGGTGVATLSAAVWLYRYLKGRHPRGSQQVDHVMGRIHETAEHMKHKAQDVAGQLPMPTVA